MSFRLPQPSNEDDFELFCLRFLRELWQCPTLQQYGKRGERQYGIDLIDEAGGPPLRAVQCKHHEPDKTIPPAEIESEVAQALGAGLPLDEYYILTTARKSTQGQNAVIRINRDHQARGGFKVYVWPWAVIEDHLAQMDDAAQERVLRGDSGRSGPAVCRMMAGVMLDHLDRPLYASATVLDHELEAVKGLIDRHELEVAENKLREIEARAPDKLQPHQWYQLKALRAKVLTDRWEWEKAGRELLDAKRFLPATERARINEALGYELTGDPARAHALATDLRAEFPHTVRLLTIWVRTAPADTPYAAIVETAAPLAKVDEELTLALAMRALAGERFDEARTHARRATEIDADSPHAWFLLGQARHAAGSDPTRGIGQALLREAEDHYTRAARLAREQKMSGLEAAIRFNRGKVRHALGGRNADPDFAAAIDLAGPGHGLRTQYASYLLEVGRYDDALRELEAETGGPTAAARFYEAVARHERNAGDDRARAVGLLQQVIAADPAERWTDAHVHLVQWAVDAKAPARTTIAGSRLGATDPLVYHALCGWLAEADGDAEGAKAEYRQALAALTDAAPRDHVFLLAQVLASAGDDEAAVPLFLRAYRPGVFDLECRKLLGCARRLERHDVTSRVCRELRQAGAADPRVVQTEIEVLQLYDPEEALRVAEEYLATHPDHRFITLWQSGLALRLGRPALVVSDPARLPPVDELTPEGTGLVLHVLAETGQHAAALRYAYAALRTHFDEEFAHGQYISHFLDLSKHSPDLAVGGTAGPGMAVCYREDGDDADRWLVIEDGADPELARGEYAPDHPVSRALAGRRVGEAVVLADDGLQPRTVTIREAFHKSIYRFRDCLSQFQVRFPGASAVQLVRVGSGDGFDFSAVVKSLEDRKKHIDGLDEQYRTQPLPLYAYAKLAGRDEFAAWGHLASSRDLGIRCFDGRADDLRAGLDLAGRAKTVVVDLTALLTLARLDLLGPVLGGGWKSFVVAQTTFARLEYLAELAEDDRRSEGGVELTEEGTLGYSPVAPEHRDRHAAFVGSIRDAVRDHCQVSPCPQAADLDPKRRTALIEVLGRHNLDSMLLASGPDTTLWTDDLILGIVGRTDFGASRVWSQAVLFRLREDGVITHPAYERAVAKLLGWHYHGVVWNAETLVAAAEVADWRMDHWPAAAAMRELGNPGAGPIDRLRIAAEAVRAVWRRDLPAHSRQGFLFAALAGLASLRLIRRLYQAVPRYFSLDVFSAGEVRTCIEYWLRRPTGLVQP